MNVKDLFGWAATILTAGFYISLITPFFNIFKGIISYKDAPIVIIIISYINCIIWVIYGTMIHSNQIKACNTVGGISTLILIIIYLAYEIRKYCLNSIIYVLILVIGSIIIFKFLTVIINDAQIIGKICVMAKFFVFISPVQLIYRVIKEKNYILIPIYASFVSFLSCICWVSYGFFINDFNVVIPNAIGLILALIQFYVYFFYKKKYPNLSQRTSSLGIENISSENNKKDHIHENLDNIIKVKPVKIVTKFGN